MGASGAVWQGWAPDLWLSYSHVIQARMPASSACWTAVWEFI